MTRRLTLRTAIAAAILVVASGAHAASMTVYKSPTCGCCAKWIEHVRSSGFDVKVIEIDDVARIKAKHGVPKAAASCHTTLIGGYVVEGHVPASDIKRLLSSKPKARGIAVAGMPMGSPGMEHGSHHEPYQTLLLKKDGTTQVFASH